MESAEDAQEKQEKRRLVELVHALLGAHVLHVLRGAHLLVPGRPGEARDRVFGVAGESLRTGGHVLGAGSPKNEVLQSDQKVSYLDHLSLQHIYSRFSIRRIYRNSYINIERNGKDE